MEFHPLTNILPMMDAPALAALCEDIRLHGLREPIWLVGNQILDGRNRWRAAEDLALGLLPSDFRSFTPDMGDPLAFVLSQNLHRRHLSEAQRAMLGAEISKLPRGANQHTSRDAPSQQHVAKLLNVGVRNLQRAKVVLEKGSDEVIAEVKCGRIEIDTARRITKLSSEHEAKAIAAARAGKTNVVRLVVKQGIRAQREAETAAAMRALPTVCFGVIVADPPWGRTVYSRETGLDRAADNHYATAHTNDRDTQDDEIKALDVASIAADHCVLGLWCTDLDRGIDGLRAWGFRYQTYFCWAKDIVPTAPTMLRIAGAAGMGYWRRDRCEILLIGTRGNLVCPAPGTQGESVWFAARGEHSVKPDCSYGYFEKHWPNTPKIELYARRAREGWACWGAEAPTQAAE